MTLQPNSLLRALLVAFVSAAMVLGLAGCGAPAASTSGQKSDDASKEAPVTLTSAFGTGADTAQGHYDAAEKAMKAVAPDAVFVTVQTGAPVTNPSPMWVYLFASKEKNKAYAVTVAKGKPSKPLALETESLRASEWAKVPTTTADWKVDSDVALKQASAAFTKRLDMAPPKRFQMGMSVFVAETEGTSTPKPYVWAIAYEADEGAAVPGVLRIQVNAKTGAVLPIPE
jgi:hypothetical protein